MENTSKNETSVEAPLPLIEGLVMPWTKDRAVVGIAKFRPAESERLDRWIPGLQFRGRRGGLVYTMIVERYILAKHIPWTTSYQRGQFDGYSRRDTLPRTIPHVVVVRVLAVSAEIGGS